MQGNSYDQHIIRILTEVGDKGISVRHLAKHVYNLSCTLFYQPDAKEIHRYVQSFLTRKSKSTHPTVEKTAQWGHYRLNAMGKAKARQLQLLFSDDSKQEKTTMPKSEDQSLDLFD